MSILKIKDGSTWEEIPAGGVGVPSGGNAGDVLVKSSSTDYATGWQSLGITFEYEGNHGSEVFNSSWTATYDGIAIMQFQPNSGSGNGYWYIKDSTDNQDVAFMAAPRDQLSRSASFPIIKGHTYTSSNMNAVSTANLFCYKIKLVVT